MWCVDGAISPSKSEWRTLSSKSNYTFPIFNSQHKISGRVGHRFHIFRARVLGVDRAYSKGFPCCCRKKAVVVTRLNTKCPHTVAGLNNAISGSHRPARDLKIPAVEHRHVFCNRTQVLDEYPPCFTLLCCLAAEHGNTSPHRASTSLFWSEDINYACWKLFVP